MDGWMEGGREKDIEKKRRKEEGRERERKHNKN